MDGKIKVVWVCEFSNPQIRKRLIFKNDRFDLFVRKLFHKQSMINTDYGVWNTNGIEEFKGYSDIELYVISPHYHIRGETQCFNIEGVHYCFFNDEKNTLFFQINNRFKKKRPNYQHNRLIIKRLIYNIHPDIIHVIGAENHHYSLSALDVPANIPLIVELQTLVSDPDFIKKYPKYNKYNIECEKKVLRRADYIGTTIKEYREIIAGIINPQAVFLDLKLAVGFNITPISVPKEFDFIYYSVNINKAFDLALEAFAIAHKKQPDINLCVVGYYSLDYKKQIDKRIAELGLEPFIHFQGHQPTHNDVLNWVAKSRFALLPLKFDIVSTTIRESMSLGIPVITTITSGTPTLNKNRESVLLSEVNDHEAMADNMIKLLYDKQFGSMLSANSLETVKELYDNTYSMREWVKAYQTILNYGTE